MVCGCGTRRPRPHLLFDPSCREDGHVQNRVLSRGVLKHSKQGRDMESGSLRWKRRAKAATRRQFVPPTRTRLARWADASPVFIPRYALEKRGTGSRRQADEWEKKGTRGTTRDSKADVVVKGEVAIGSSTQPVAQLWHVACGMWQSVANRSEKMRQPHARCRHFSFFVHKRDER